MSTKTKNKKKTIDTTMGKAGQLVERPVDVAHLRKPMTTSVGGLRDIFELFKNATDEVQQYIAYECDIMYECRICSTIFRSLANFILHKRDYCTEKFGLHTMASNGHVIHDDNNCKDDKNDKLISVIDKLMKRQEIQQLAKDLVEDTNDVEEIKFPKQDDNKNDLLLQKIETSDCAVFQTRCNKDNPEETIKNEVLEIHASTADSEAVLGSDGKVTTGKIAKVRGRKSFLPQDLLCPICDKKFATKKTLTVHMKYKHNPTKAVYPCFLCKETLSNPWCVYRHLCIKHHLTIHQVRKMRDQIYSNSVPKVDEPIKEEETKIDTKNDEENQWLDHVEGDNDLQMCAGCGKKFERKAALQSHSQMCTKRIAFCNVIKSNGAKSKAAEAKLHKLKITRIGKEKSVVILKGSAKRKGKPYQIRKDAEPIVLKEKLPKKRTRKKVKNITKPILMDIIGVPTEELAEKPPEKPVEELESILIEDSDSSHGSEPPCTKPELPETKDVDFRMLKRKRTMSCDSPQFNDNSRTITDDDESFLQKATPYMEETKLECISCQISYPSRYQLLWHMSLHFSWYRFQCSRCAFMSFNKYECISHAHAEHCIPNHLMDSTVLPIANWKTILMSHPFRELNTDVSPEIVDNPAELNQTETIQDDSSDTNEIKTKSYTNLKNLSNSCEDLRLCFPEPIFNGHEESTSDAPTDSSPEKSECELDAMKTTKKSRRNDVPTKIRPIRSRTKSIKTLQNDFIYDLNKVIKLNNRHRKTLGKYVPNPLKTVKEDVKEDNK